MLALYALAFALLAVMWSVVLVDSGMLLESLQRWAREKYRHVNAIENPLRIHELDDQWWWKPLWGCYRCVAGQFGFWGYLLLWWHEAWRYSLLEHLVFSSLTVFLACILTRVYRWTQE